MSSLLSIRNLDDHFGEEECLVKLPYREVLEMTGTLKEFGEKRVRGLIPPFDLDHLAYTFSCMATVRDHFPDHAIYAPVPKWCAREALRSAGGAGFKHFIFPFYDPWAFVHQTIYDLVDGKVVHVAGGDPKVEGWTWSEEGL